MNEMGKEKFVSGLKELGYEVEVLGENRIAISMYKIKSGRFEGQEIKVGFDVPTDFPVTPPGGPHISPRLLPINPGGQTHTDRAHLSPFGPEWEYLSRPYPNNSWPKTKRTVLIYMWHVNNLLETL